MATQSQSMTQHGSAWSTLCRMAQDRPLHLQSLLLDARRAQQMQFSAAGITLDASRQRIDQLTLNTLMAWAREARVPQQAQAMFRGECINTTEERPVLHVALRGSHVAEPTWGLDISDQIERELDRFLNFAQCVRQCQWLGYDGRAITDVVNIGIGGSDLGPRMATQALAGNSAAKRLGQPRVHYISNPDASAFYDLLSGLDPARTGFIVQSKTFTTQETLTLAESARSWLRGGGCPDRDVPNHMVAVTARADRAYDQGFLSDQTFLFWDWVGGRYSVWSAIGLPLAISIGAHAFRQFLQGARDMDEHFLGADPEQNLPLVMALVGAWNGNFLGATTLHIAPYAYGLSLFVPFVQQLEMESNGKSTGLDGQRVGMQTSPIVWGGLGIDGQHAYFQLIHQGTHLIPVDFIGVLEHNSAGARADEHHQVVLSNLLAQAQALALGRNTDDTLAALAAEGLAPSKAMHLAPHRTYVGNIPNSIIWLECLNPRSLGALIALYEHKVFCQAALWGINAFDQWGVELGKSMIHQMTDEGQQQGAQP